MSTVERAQHATPEARPMPARREASLRVWHAVPEAPAAEHPLRQELWNVLTATDTEKGYEPDRTRQEAVFDRLPWASLLADLRDHIGLKDGVPAGKELPAGTGKMLRGQVFELLIGADPEFGERTPLEAEILNLAHSPEAYGLGRELGHHRNPDLAFIIVRDGDHAVIEGIGESKMGRLNVRAYKQLSETGFLRGIEALVTLVNALPDPSAYGLTELGELRKQVGPDAPILTIDPDFMQHLIVPANRRPERLSGLINYAEFDRDTRQELYGLLRDTDKVNIENAAFSTGEVSALTRALTGML